MVAMRHKEVYVSHIIWRVKQPLLSTFLETSVALGKHKIHPILPKHSIKTGSNGTGTTGAVYVLA